VQTQKVRGGRAAAPPVSPGVSARVSRRARAAARCSVLLVIALAPFPLLEGCRAPEVRSIPARTPLRADPGKISSIAVVTYGGSVDPARVSDGSFCPHADRAQFARYFSLPEEILAGELEQAGYPVTRVPAGEDSALLLAYPARVWIAFVGDSRCEKRVPLFGPRRVSDCSVRLRIAAEGDRGPGRLFERTGESSLEEPVDAIEEGGGPSPPWEAAVHDAIRQVLEDPGLAHILQAPGAAPP